VFGWWGEGKAKNDLTDQALVIFIKVIVLISRPKKIIIMTKLILSTVLLSFVYAFSQNIKIKWGEFDKFKGLPISNILPISENEYFDLNFKPQGMALTYSTLKFFPIIRVFKNNALVNEIKFEGTAPGKNETFEYFELIDGKAYLFTTTREKEERNFYAYEIDKTLKIGKPMKLMSHSRESRESIEFKLSVSDNGQFFAVLLELEDKKNDEERFEYEIFTKNFNSVKKGKYTLPHPRKECDLAQHHISNNGDYFVSYKVYETNKSGKVRDLNKLKKVVIRQLSSEKVDDYEIKPESGLVKKVYFKTNENGNLTLTGLWGDEKTTVKGVFTMIIDFSNKKIENEEFYEFDKKFIVEAYPTKQKEQYEKAQKAGKTNDSQSPSLFSYVFREMIPLADGSALVLMEQSYVYERTTRDSKGNVSTVFVYNENGIIAYKIDPDGSIAWTTYIHKEQATTNDGGYAISFGHVYDNNKITLFFHDNKQNYSSSGKYNKQRNRASFMKKNYCFAQATISISSGDVSRSIVHDLKTGEGFVLPRETMRLSQTNKGVLIMVKKFNKPQKRYGIVTI